VDGLAATYGGHHVVVLNSSVSNDRARMNAAHELGHILYNDCINAQESQKNRTLETRAMDFASHLLMPSSILRSAFMGRSMVRLVGFKERYGISLAAMIYRAEREDVIPNSLAKKLWVEFSKRGWRRQEPGSVRPDRATRFEQLLDGAIVRSDITWKEAAEITGVRVDELKARVQQALGFGNEYPEDPRNPEMLRLIQ
jgi:Zn-dependent peptidase ImmA (M78 family)